MLLKIASDRPDLHSGIEGGAVDEPMIDMSVFSCFIKISYCFFYTQILKGLDSSLP